LGVVPIKGGGCRDLHFSGGITQLSLRSDTTLLIPWVSCISFCITAQNEYARMVVGDLTSSYPSENDHHQGLGPTGGSIMEDVVLG
jgi:hypothetical protein